MDASTGTTWIGVWSFHSIKHKTVSSSAETFLVWNQRKKIKIDTNRYEAYRLMRYFTLHEKQIWALIALSFLEKLKKIVFLSHHRHKTSHDATNQSIMYVKPSDTVMFSRTYGIRHSGTLHLGSDVCTGQCWNNIGGVMCWCALATSAISVRVTCSKLWIKPLQMKVHPHR